jgi:hypothetical protein
MSKIRIRIQNKTLEMDKQAFYSIVNGISKNVYSAAQSIYEDHRLGLLNANGSNQTPYLWSQDKEQSSLLRAIEDEQIRYHFAELKKFAGKLEKHDKQIVLWLAKHFGIKSLDSLQDRQKLNRRLSTERRKAAKDGTGLLSWVREPAYQKLIQETLKTVNDVKEIVSEIDENIRAITN